MNDIGKVYILDFQLEFYQILSNASYGYIASDGIWQSLLDCQLYIYY
jgi:hypothetical protein